MSPLLDCEVVVTKSGAPAMRDRITGELMHPVVGPIVESERLYVGPSRLIERLEADERTPLVLLDVGLGAGSNAVAAAKVSEMAKSTARRLEIVSFDHSVSAMELAIHAEHAVSFGFVDSLLDLARGVVAHGVHETNLTRWRLVLGDLLPKLAEEPALTADIVFWDPFSPRANPSLWTMTAFAALRRHCRDGATIHTYSAATAVRSALLLGGFAVGFGDETNNARQTTIAAVDARDLSHPLDGRWLERLARSSAPYPSDAPADAYERIARMPQFSRVGA